MHVEWYALLVTGHAHPDGAEPDWAALARSRTTLVIYMGVRRLGDIAAALLAGGLAGATPAAVIENGTLPEQVSVVTTLASLARDVATSGIESPAIVVVGDVARLARQAVGALLVSIG